VRREVLGFGERDDGGSHLAQRGLVVADDVLLAQERAHRQAGGVAGAPAGGQHVVGAGAVVAQRNGGVGADEDRAGVADADGDVSRVAGLDRQVLRGVRVDDCQALVEILGRAPWLAALFAGAYATGSYGGYFAASQGVLQIGVFGLLLRESLQRLNAIKNVLTLAVNGVAAAAYVVVATDRVDWRAAGLVATGSLLGGYLGARVGRRLPPAVLRTAIVVLGCVAIAVLLLR